MATTSTNIMKCPSCNSDLKQYKYHGLVVDICPNCSGMWFDPGEMMEYIDFLITEREDIPEAKIELQKKTVSLDLVAEPSRACPRCNQQMKKINFAYDSNIILDNCTSCNGIWTDGDEIYKLAIFRKGNPRLDALGKDILRQQRKLDDLRDLAEVGRSLSTSAGFRIFLPKIVLPLRGDIATRIVPGVVLGIILANITVFVYQFLYVKEALPFFREFGLIPEQIIAGKQWYSFISSMFVHAGLWHLAGNMLFLWIFACAVEETLGHFRFIVFYLLFGLSASMLHVLTHTGSAIPAVGASGAISGVMGAYFILHPRSKIATLFIDQVINVPAYLYIGGWILFQLLYAAIYSSTRIYPSVAWFAHIGGFASGIILTYAYTKIRAK